MLGFEDIRTRLGVLRQQISAIQPPASQAGEEAECPTCGGPAVRIFGRRQQRDGIRGNGCKCPIWWAPIKKEK